VPDLPRRSVTRTVKLATLPLGYAGRTALGFGKRVGGKSAEAVSAEMQARTAEQVFRVLGELKGGAMKVGQAMSIFEAALPEEMAGPYRETLTKLQDAAPPMDTATVHEVLTEAFGRQWRRRFESFDDRPAASASIGQVHRAVWRDGRAVAVKVQYPGAAQALSADLDQVSRLARMVGTLTPGMDVKALVAELRERMVEELDYSLEAQAQAAFAAAFAGDELVAVPGVVAQDATVLVTEWLDGAPMSRLIVDGTRTQRNTMGEAYLRFLFEGPSRAGLLHADPHPGNFRLTPDGRLGVLDFGAVARMPDGLPRPVGRLLRVALAGDHDTVVAGLRDEGFVRPGVTVDAGALMDYLGPFIEPAEVARFHFTRAWLREQFARINDPRSDNWSIGLRLNLPPDYLLVHRVWLGGVGVLCQLDARVGVRGVMEDLLPGFADDPVPHHP